MATKYYEIGARVKPLSRDEEFTTPYEVIGYHEQSGDANWAARLLQSWAPGLEIRVLECRD